MKSEELEKIWNDFSKIPINNNDCIELDFYIWKVGTSRIHIWKWFNKNLQYGFEYLNMTLIQLKTLWSEFSDIPINNKDEIEENFYCWEKGTYRFDIWHWFDEKLPNGIAEWTAA